MLGTWQVENRFNNRDSDLVFGNNYYLIFESDSYTSRNGHEVKGRWTLTKEQEFIYNPQVNFFQENDTIGNAIITRFLETEENNQIIYRLTLYFTNGLELILKRETTTKI